MSTQDSIAAASYLDVWKVVVFQGMLTMVFAWSGCFGPKTVEEPTGEAVIEPTAAITVVSPSPDKALAVLDQMADLEDPGPYVLQHAVATGGFSQAWFAREDMQQRFFLLDVVASEELQARYRGMFELGQLYDDSLARTMGYSKLETIDHSSAHLDRKIVPWVRYRWTTLRSSGTGSVLWLRCDGRPEMLLLYSDVVGDESSYDPLETLSFASRFHWCR